MSSYDLKKRGRKDRIRSKCKSVEGRAGVKGGLGIFFFFCSPSVGTVFALQSQQCPFIFKKTTSKTTKPATTPVGVGTKVKARDWY